MNVKQKILQNIKEQSVVRGRLDQLQQDANSLNSDLQRLGGKMEILQEIFKEETGLDLNDVVDQDQDLKREVMQASEEGAKVAEGMTQNADNVIEMPQQNEPPSARTTGTTHTGNKTIKPATEQVVEQTRRAQPPTIVIDDVPPTPDDDDDD